MKSHHSSRVHLYDELDLMYLRVLPTSCVVIREQSTECGKQNK